MNLTQNKDGAATNETANTDTEGKKPRRKKANSPQRLLKASEMLEKVIAPLFEGHPKLLEATHKLADDALEQLIQEKRAARQ